MENAEPQGWSRRNLFAALVAVGISGPLLAEIIAATSAAAAMTVQYQLPFPLVNPTFAFYNPYSGSHRGYDFNQGTPATSGAPIPAIANGTVAAKGSGTVYNYNYGHWVRIDHADGKSSFYAHMNAASPLLINASIARGATVGATGSSGSSSGVHLHLGLLTTGTSTFQDPISYINDRLAPPTQIKQGNGMTTRFAQIGSGTGGTTGGLNTLCALAGDAGYPCPANFQEYLRNPADSSVLDRAATEFAIHGPVIWVAQSQWAALRDAYTLGVPQTVNLSTDDRALLAEISTKLDALQP